MKTRTKVYTSNLTGYISMGLNGGIQEVPKSGMLLTQMFLFSIKVSMANSFLCLEIITCDTSLHTMNHPDCIVCSFLENSIVLKRGKKRNNLLEWILVFLFSMIYMAIWGSTMRMCLVFTFIRTHGCQV